MGVDRKMTDRKEQGLLGILGFGLSVFGYERISSMPANP